MKAADVMTKQVRAVPPGTAVRAAIRLMLDLHISGLPVVDSAGKLVGVVTEGDLLRRVELGTEKQRSGWLSFLRGPGRGAESYVRSHARRIEDLMTIDAVTVGEATPLDEVVQLMEKHRIKRVPVVRGDTLVGIISRADLLRPLLAALDADATEAPESDDAMLAAFKKVIAAEGWAPKIGLEISVTDAVVTLSGIIDDDRERWALRVIAENLPGVRGVKDELVTVETTTGTVITGL